MGHSATEISTGFQQDEVSKIITCNRSHLVMVAVELMMGRCLCSLRISYLHECHIMGALYAIVNSNYLLMS